MSGVKKICGKAKSLRGLKRRELARTAFAEIKPESTLNDLLVLHGLSFPTVKTEGLHDFAKAHKEVMLKDAFGAPYHELEDSFAARLHDVVTGCGAGDASSVVYKKAGVPFAISDQLAFLDHAAGRTWIQMKRVRFCAMHGGKLGVADRLVPGCEWLPRGGEAVAEIFGVKGEVELGRAIEVYAHEELAKMATRKFHVLVSVGPKTHDFVVALFEGACRRSFDRAWICEALRGKEETCGLGDYEAAAGLIVELAEYVFRRTCVLDEAAVDEAAKERGI